MEMRYNIYSHGVEISFDAKPPTEILSILKANGFRWNRHFWHRRKVTGTGNLVAAIEKRIEVLSGIKRPDGKCWTCGDPNGYFRNRGAATPVYCDKCDRESGISE